MSVINGKHVIVLADVEQYRGDAIVQEVARIAKKDGVNPMELMKEYCLGQNAKLVEIVNQNADQYLNIMIEELNNLIENC